MPRTPIIRFLGTAAAAGTAVPVFLYHYRSMEEEGVNILKQSTAVDVLIGPFVDLTDGATAEEGESPTVLLSKNGQALAAKHDDTTPTHDDAGYYNCELDTTDTNTVGDLVLVVEKSATALPVRHRFQVIEEAIYDALYAASAAAFDANADVTVGAIAAGAIDAAAIADNAIDAGAIAANAIDFATFAADCKTGTGLKANVESVSADAITAAAIAADAGTELGTAVWATAARTLTAATNITSTDAKVPITAGGYVSADVKAINAVAVDGAGTALDPWGPP